jgi:monoterpene epsilon-lactone hydrolase
MAKLKLEDIIARLRARPKGGPDPGFLKARAALERESAKAPLPDGVDVTPVDAAGVPGEWVQVQEGAAAGEAPAVLFLHGGGYVMGSCATHRPLAAHLSKATGGPVLTIDYRLAPEHPFPAALDDARTAWHWLLATDGMTPGRAVIAGDSAGGGLTAATVLALKGAGEPLPAGAVLISPLADMEPRTETYRSLAQHDPMVSEEDVRAFTAAYLAGADPKDPLASPIHGDWAGAPPLLIQIGSAEVLLDDARGLAERARDAGVDVDLQVWDRMIHVWHFFCGLIDEADEAVQQAGAFIRKVCA